MLSCKADFYYYFCFCLFHQPSPNHQNKMAATKTKTKDSIPKNKQNQGKEGDGKSFSLRGKSHNIGPRSGSRNNRDLSVPCLFLGLMPMRKPFMVIFVKPLTSGWRMPKGGKEGKGKREGERERGREGERERGREGERERGREDEWLGGKNRF